MDALLASTDKEVLVDIVKMAQKRQMSGSKGPWKEFLKSFDKYGSSVSNPALKPIDTLIQFLKTFTEPDDLKLFRKVLMCHSVRNEVEQFMKNAPDNGSAEQSLVRLTVGHPQYAIDFSFPSYEEDWLIIKNSKSSKAMNSTAIIAVDCEMVLCEDGTEALVKVCAVDRNLQVKLDELVNPNKVIADYRTEITGISATDLDGVSHSLRDVQRSMKKLLSHGTILVGHSLNNDLKALKIDHGRVIDTSYIFKHADGTSSKKPSLSWLCKVILGFELREKGKPHNCLDDACAAMKLVLAKLEGKTNDIIPAESSAERKLDAAKLLVHRIPVSIHSTDLQSVLPGDFTIEMKESKKSMPTYSFYAIFKNQQAANEAFENLEGDLGKDSYGRPQKLVNFKLDSRIYDSISVCKIFCDDSVDPLSPKKRSTEDENTFGMPKKLKADQTRSLLEDFNHCSNHCEIHLNEIERLKRDLTQRDKEISNLNKIITAFARKQGL